MKGPADSRYAGSFPDHDSPLLQYVRSLITRIVWVQDVGRGADYLARGADLRLMGLDTDDPRGEREILPAPRNMAKPLFIHEGNQVIFSDRIHGTMHRALWRGRAQEETLLSEIQIS